MSKAIRWTDEAYETFNHTVVVIENKWGTRQAGIFIKRVDKILSLIATQPDMYKESLAANVRQATISKQTSMFYKVENLSIIVLYFWDNRQDPLFE